MNIVERVARIFPQVIVGIGINPDKKYTFTLDERLDMARHSLSYIPNVRVDSYRGLTVDYATEQRIPLIVKGVRNETDADYERTLYEVGESQKRNIETMVLFAKPELRSVSSSVAKTLQKEYGDVHTLVPLYVKQKLDARISGQYLLGITGEIGAGKSYVASRLVEIGESRGIPVYNIELDRIGHHILSDLTDPLYQETREKIRSEFSAKVCAVDGSIDRRALGETVFQNPESMRKLNSLMYEPIMLRLRREREDKKGILLINSALIAESNISHICNNNVVLVGVNSTKQAERLVRRGLTREQIARRVASQYTLNKKHTVLESNISRYHHGKAYLFDNSSEEYNLGVNLLFDCIVRDLQVPAIGGAA